MTRLVQSALLPGSDLLSQGAKAAVHNVARSGFFSKLTDMNRVKYMCGVNEKEEDLCDDLVTGSLTDNLVTGSLKFQCQ
jgi:hypothetical protein